MRAGLAVAAENGASEERIAFREKELALRGRVSDALIAKDTKKNDIEDAKKTAEGVTDTWTEFSKQAAHNIQDAMADFFIKDSEMRSSDNGRFNVTGNEQDRYVFRVPPLRNVAVSAPYFHDGSVSGLNQAVEVMIQFQLGRSLILEDVDAIVAFLNTLTGELPEGVLQ